jgi:hypothetical protein
MIALLVSAPAAQAQTADKPAVEGIKIRGHWVIEVREPDGSLVERREFDNALTPSGGELLVQWLLRNGSPTRWTIQLGSYSLPGPCANGTFNSSTTNQCFIVDPLSSQPPTGTSVFPTLTEFASVGSTNFIRLTGNATALVQGEIEYVATRQGRCVATTAPLNCNVALGPLQFTVHDLRDSQGQPAPLSVAAGRIVQVTVTISFS